MNADQLKSLLKGKEIPALHLVPASGAEFFSQIGGNPLAPEDFAWPQQDALLSDLHFEIRLASYSIRLEFVSGQASSLLERQAKLLSLMENATS